jgi:hypothetical protein
MNCRCASVSEVARDVGKEVAEDDGVGAAEEDDA